VALIKWIAKTLVNTMYLPLFDQFLILIPIFFAISLGIFYFLRTTNIRLYGSKEEYYKSHSTLSIVPYEDKVVLSNLIQLYRYDSDFTFLLLGQC
jgi:hypothetical protein